MNVRRPEATFKLASGYTRSEVNLSFKKLSLKFHPDKYASATIGEKFMLNAKFQKLVEMRDILLLRAKSCEDKPAKVKEYKYDASRSSYSSAHKASVKPKRKSPAARSRNQFDFFDNYRERSDAYINNLKELHKKSKNILIFAIMNNKSVADIEGIISSNNSLIHTKDHLRNSLLHIACLADHVEAIKLLVNKYNLDINMKNDYDQTPLLISISAGSNESMSALMSLGANYSDRVSSKVFTV